MTRLPIKPKISEDDVQKTIVQFLQIAKFEVLVTSRRKKRCPNCNAYDNRGDGASQGIPDLIISRADWPEFCWVGIEIKSPTTKLSAEQKMLAFSGRIAVCRSIEDAQEAISRFCHSAGFDQPRSFPKVN